MQHDNITLTSKEFSGEIRYGKSTATEASGLLIIDYNLSRKRVDIFRSADYSPVEATSKVFRHFSCAAAVVTIEGNRPLSMNTCNIHIEGGVVLIKNIMGKVEYPADVIKEISIYLEA